MKACSKKKGVVKERKTREPIETSGNRERFGNTEGSWVIEKTVKRVPWVSNGSLGNRERSKSEDRWYPFGNLCCRKGRCVTQRKLGDRAEIWVN